MVFAVEEINRNSSLLPGVELGYRIMDSCDHVHTSLKALFSLVSHSNTVMSEVNQEEETEKKLDKIKDRGAKMEGVKTIEKTRKKRILTTLKKRGTNSSRSMPQSLENNGNDKEENVTEERMDNTQSETLPSCLADSPVPAVIGLASSSPTRAVAQILGPFNLPLVRKL